MLTFAFIALTLLIYAAALVSAYLYARKEFKVALANQSRYQVKRMRSAQRQITAMRADLDQQAATIKFLLSTASSTPSKNLTQFPTGGLLKNTEDRYERDLLESKQVSVKGQKN